RALASFSEARGIAERASKCFQRDLGSRFSNAVFIRVPFSGSTIHRTAAAAAVRHWVVPERCAGKTRMATKRAKWLPPKGARTAEIGGVLLRLQRPCPPTAHYRTLQLCFWDTTGPEGLDFPWICAGIPHARHYRLGVRNGRTSAECRPQQTHQTHRDRNRPAER